MKYMTNLYVDSACGRNRSYFVEFEGERSEIFCGFSVTSINLVTSFVLLIACCMRCSPLGWWMSNYLLITIIASNLVAASFFWYKTYLFGILSLCLLSEKIPYLGMVNKQITLVIMLTNNVNLKSLLSIN